MKENKPRVFGNAKDVATMTAYMKLLRRRENAIAIPIHSLMIFSFAAESAKNFLDNKQVVTKQSGNEEHKYSREYKNFRTTL